MASSVARFFMLFQLVTVLSLQLVASSPFLENKVRFGVSMGGSIIERVLPRYDQQQLSSSKEIELRSVLSNVVQLWDIRQSLEAPSATDQELKGFKITLKYILQDACAWMNQTLQDGFGCTDDEFGDLRGRLKLHERLVRTEEAFNHYLVARNVTCS